MINFSDITQAVENVLKSGTAGYTIERCSTRNQDPNAAAKGNGHISIYKGSIDHDAYTTGSRRWNAKIETIIEIQCADNEGWQADDALENAVQEILGIIDTEAKKQAGPFDGQIGHINGIRIDYETNADAEMYHVAAKITIRSEIRT